VVKWVPLAGRASAGTRRRLDFGLLSVNYTKPAMTMDLTYNGADGKEYGPVALSEIQKWAGEGRITGATQVSRSDQQGWATAASLPELGVKDSTGPTPVAAPSAADAVLEKQLKGGGSWFYWIAGLSLVNSVMALSGSATRFVLGLGVMQIFDGLAQGFGSGAGLAVAVVLDLLAAAVFVFFGVFANKRHTWSFIVGMALYALDGLIFLIGPDWLGVGFHAFVLFCLFRGFKACRALNAVS
jgi:hypothetical protein